jgi:peptidoglycan/xylan/chitin deacetylase (PgdA/CDA1 family)
MTDFIQTFDDGPTNVSSILIDYLGTVNQKTTYFQIGTNIADNYLLTQRQYSEGHEIAVHTWSHNDLTLMSGQQVYAELAWTIYVIHASIGQTPKLFRPPYGNINDVVRTAAAQLGLTVFSPYICTDERLFYGAVIPMIGKFLHLLIRMIMSSIRSPDSFHLAQRQFYLNMNLELKPFRQDKIFRK